MLSYVYESGFAMVAFYTAINALIMLILALLVTRARVKNQVEIGDGGKPEMTGPLRAHANNTEYVPTALLLMWALLPIGGSVWMVHGIGLPLTIGRLLHGFGLSRGIGTSSPRFLGVMLTWIAYIVGIVSLLWLVFFPQAAAS
ncbi:MAG: MAPEG family protein [Alphaproteobacteria bacterium]|jgi:uncharacterized membrane protein YecN with MAPEG domain|nr:MAPEG family protein [Alphaproteobacteria bacterium]MBN9557129.1 MAPEG family protein [Alphaproteobacteria bacterium]MBN9566006.1 MAPEG family protein [Alphaproteobacteria bacterium]MBN9592567.1 MAPEG family protein [Alphaproteobacteria bacterium]OJU55472.1 MAG: hypothetical protein BGO00_14145 [Alphaproteobacteria bacterium 62-8]